MSIISRFPEGLLAFLDLKSRGEVPFTLDASVRPGIDMAPFWELGGNPRNVLSFNSGPVAASTYGNFSVPTGEVWLVRSAYVNLRSSAIGLEASAQLKITRGTGLPTHVLASTFWPAGTAFAALTETVAAWQPTWPMFLRSGDVVFGTVDLNVVAPGALTVGLNYTPFRA